ncbi:hypothetical protein AM305_07383 [Actinobacillus minor NM305]|uniref:Uncharacterized protein n=1 Tax=Actinobacillus minor NM305 TaxID=637911 RepID=C5S0Q1_9PAST|nr:hypothetical protein [Actinobacillus minor]EER47484.1 hypothetical protein AM305_07383 [Actinobacillus minor NM305]MDY5107615.1 hypothetical protein [Actinobacillus minor]
MKQLIQQIEQWTEDSNLIKGSTSHIVTYGHDCDYQTWKSLREWSHKHTSKTPAKNFRCN